MSRGVLMTGHNNRTIDYGKIALANACLIKKHLKNNNVTLITDVGTMEWLEKNYSKRLSKDALNMAIILSTLKAADQVALLEALTEPVARDAIIAMAHHFNGN